MDNQIYFWVIWGLISIWVLKTFYYSYDQDKLDKLRKTAFGLDLLVLILFFLPWLPNSQANLTGWQLILEGNPLVTFLFIIIVSTISLFITPNKSLLKIGVVSHIIASILFIATMIILMPDTISLSIQSIAPIIASLILLTGNVVALLLWQQLQLKLRKLK